MALTNFKNNVKQDNEFDDTQRLMCTVPGCKNRWSVKIEGPKCSFHQWGHIKNLLEKNPNQETSHFEHPANTDAWWQK